ncbi:hypothetical protein FRC12_008600 [Ceratobasidium sp. 428]|nr:hypothetical protein FRC12_008600 [Ceratobasidium sp. 428]
MATRPQLLINQFGLDIFAAMTPSALPTPFSIGLLHDWSPACCTQRHNFADIDSMFSILQVRHFAMFSLAA